jgi:hypothetical protein
MALALKADHFRKGGQKRRFGGLSVTSALPR